MFHGQSLRGRNNPFRPIFMSDQYVFNYQSNIMHVLLFAENIRQLPA